MTSSEPDLVVKRNPGPAALLGTQVVSGLGLGTGFAVASRVVPVALNRLGVNDTTTGVARHNPTSALDDLQRSAAMATVVGLSNPRKLHPALLFMNRRVKELHAGGMPMKAAMKKAGAEWRAQKRSGGGTTRRHNPPAFVQRSAGSSQRLPIVSGAKYIRGMPVRFRKNDVEGIVVGVQPGRRKEGFGRFFSLMGVGPSQEPATYAVQTSYGTQEAALENDIEQRNPLTSPAMLVLLALVGYGIYQRSKAVAA